MTCDPSCDSNTATPIVVVAGFDTPNIDFTIDFRGRIQGTVTDVFGQPIKDAAVYLYDEGGQSVTSTHTDAAGAYKLAAWEPGTYHARGYRYGYVQVSKTIGSPSVTGPQPASGHWRSLNSSWVRYK